MATIELGLGGQPYGGQVKLTDSQPQSTNINPPYSDNSNLNNLFQKQNDIYKELTNIGLKRASVEKDHGNFQDLLKHENRLRETYHAVIKERAEKDPALVKLLSDPDWDKRGTALYQQALYHDAVKEYGIPSFSVNGDGRYEGTSFQIDPLQVTDSGKLGEFSHQINRQINFVGNSEAAKSWLATNELSDKFKVERTIGGATHLIPVYNYATSTQSAFDKNSVQNIPINPPPEVEPVDSLTLEKKNSGKEQSVNGENVSLEKPSDESKTYRDERLGDLKISAAYIDGETSQLHENAAMEAFKNGDKQKAKKLAEKAEKQLEAAVKAAIVNAGRVPRLYYDIDGKSEGSEATNGDASALSIAFNKYLQMPREITNEKFRESVQQANALTQGWLRNGLPQVGNTQYKYMSDKNTTYALEGGSSLKTEWTSSISVENEIRRAMALGDKKLLAALTRDSYDSSTGKYSSGLKYDPSTKKISPTAEHASDALALLILANDKFGTMTPALANQFKKAYLGGRDFTLPDGTYGYSRDDGKGNSAIPEFMYMDVNAGEALAKYMKDKEVSAKARDIKQKADTLANSLGDAYSTEYAGTGPNGITGVMRKQKKGNYYVTG